jgi:CRISPR/Cas system-associated exonuclease Cas4 (RecB family)
MNAQQINDAIRREVESRITVYPCNNLRASNIGHPCERYLYLLIKHWEEQKPPEYGLQNIFDLGNAMEEYTIGKLKAAGYEIITPTQRSWKVENPLITGREDVRIKDPEDGQLYPAEIKGLSPYEWDRLCTVQDFYESKRHYVRAYPSQLLVYMWKFEKEKGFFVLTNKLTGEVKVIDVPFDWDRADAMLKKAERVYATLADPTGKTLPAACDDIDVCDGCSLAHICTSCHAHIEADIDTGELEELIERKEALVAAHKEYDEVHEQIKKCVGDRDKVITEKHLVVVKTISKKEYVVAARDERRINISRL